MKINLKKELFHFRNRNKSLLRNFTVTSFMALTGVFNFGYSQTNLDSIFINWNKLSFQSINQKSILSEGREKEHNLYANRNTSFKLFLEIDDFEELNRNSIRYEFLKTIFLNKELPNHSFYIIENNESGYLTKLNNYIVFNDSLNNAIVYCYNFREEKWHFSSKKIIPNLILKDSALYDIDDLWKGYNLDDIIISKFENDRICRSEFFLSYTLSKQSSVKGIVEATKF